MPPYMIFLQIFGELARGLAEVPEVLLAEVRFSDSDKGNDALRARCYTRDSI